MKKIFVAIMAVASFIACTNDNVVDFDKQAIVFGSAFVDNSTRAVKATDPSYYTDGETDHNQLTQFNVYGTVKDVNIYSGQTVSKGSAGYGAEWAIEAGTHAQYWIAGASYIFDAVVDASAVTIGEGGLPTSLNCKASEQKDMLHSRVPRIGAASGNAIVAFEFNHLLSKVKFTVENTTAADATNYRYTISDIQLTNVITEGNYAVPAGTWSTVSTGTYDIASLEVKSNTTEECATEVLLIPGNKVGISLNVNVQIDNNGTWETITTTPVSNDGLVLEASHAYNFKLTVGLNNEINFSAEEMDGWDGPSDINF